MSDPTSSPASSSLGDFQFTFEIGDSSVIPPHNPYRGSPDYEQSQSLPDCVTNFPHKFGRTFHAYRAGSYEYPNDATEQERETFQYHMLHALFGNRLHLAPLSKVHPPRRILDIGTGVGNWAIAMGDEYPYSRVYGIDLSPHQPELVPPNVHFMIQDASQPWEFIEPFDYIHTRISLGSWGDFKTEIADQAFANLEPGGWFESQEIGIGYESEDSSLSPDSPLHQWAADMARAARLLNRDLDTAPMIKQWYEEAGFVDVHERVFRLPVNGWPKDARLKEIGKAWESACIQGLSGFTVALYNRIYGLSQEETELMLVPVRKELSNTKVHSWNRVFVVWGRKPYPGELKGKGKARS